MTNAYIILQCHIRSNTSRVAVKTWKELSLHKVMQYKIHCKETGQRKLFCTHLIIRRSLSVAGFNSTHYNHFDNIFPVFCPFEHTHTKPNIVTREATPTDGVTQRLQSAKQVTCSSLHNPLHCPRVFHETRNICRMKMFLLLQSYSNIASWGSIAVPG
jgi:hypothetical protein